MRTLLLILILIATSIVTVTEAKQRFCFFFCPPPKIHQHKGVPTPPNPNLCDKVVNAFSKLDPRSLDKFVESIPLNERSQARRCLEDLNR
jgi:hypothetical protein